MSREHSDRSSGAANMSGSLKDELVKHAFERCRHFFMYVFHARALTDYVNAKHGLGLGPTDILYIHATHQIDSGLRSTDVEYFGFDATDANVVNLSATGCGRTDAAHFCNLGIDAKCGSKIGPLAGDPVVFTLFEMLKKICGDTRQLPQRVNIGPDKVVDRFHGELATAILGSGKPPVSRTTLKAYTDGAGDAMKEYSKRQGDNGKLGLVACAKAYTDCYDNATESLWKQISDDAIGECVALKFDKDAYVSWL